MGECAGGMAVVALIKRIARGVSRSFEQVYTSWDGCCGLAQTVSKGAFSFWCSKGDHYRAGAMIWRMYAGSDTAWDGGISVVALMVELISRSLVVTADVPAVAKRVRFWYVRT